MFDHGLHILAPVRPLHRNNVKLFDHIRLNVLHEVISRLGKYALAPHNAVDNRPRGVASTKSLEVVFVRDVLICLLDSRIYVLRSYGDLYCHLVISGLLRSDGDLQHSSSVSCWLPQGGSLSCIL